LLDGLLRRAREVATDLTRSPAVVAASDPSGGPALLPAQVRYERLQRVVLTDEVSRTLFEEYATHRASDRGAEETGWVLLGVRGPQEATILATLPVCAERDAGEAHVWITGPAHVLASRIIRQQDRRLAMLGVVHTHPGSLRHPSRGDFKGDRDWVPQLPGSEGIFGIGTADAEPKPDGALVSFSPKPHMQCLGPLRFSWYTLGAGDKKYRDAPLELTIGPDLAKPLRPLWPVIEGHASRLDRLACQQAKVRFDIIQGRAAPALAISIRLAEPGQSVRLVLEGKDVRYYYEAGGDTFQVDLPDPLPDQGIYRLLAELAARA